MIYTLTPGIAQGRFATPTLIDSLRAAGVTHILNVCESAPLFDREAGPFSEIAWHPHADDQLLPEAEILATLDTLHRMICQPGSVVYVHCVAGWMRSPTVVWLYLLACGQDARMAAREIAKRNYEARPGHPDLVDEGLLDRVRSHGRTRYLPHPRPEAIHFS